MISRWMKKNKIEELGLCNKKEEVEKVEEKGRGGGGGGGGNSTSL